MRLRVVPTKILPTEKEGRERATGASLLAAAAVATAVAMAPNFLRRAGADGRWPMVEGCREPKLRLATQLAGALARTESEARQRKRMPEMPPVAIVFLPPTRAPPARVRSASLHAGRRDFFAPSPGHMHGPSPARGRKVKAGGQAAANCGPAATSSRHRRGAPSRPSGHHLGHRVVRATPAARGAGPRHHLEPFGCLRAPRAPRRRAGGREREAEEEKELLEGARVASCACCFT